MEAAGGNNQHRLPEGSVIGDFLTPTLGPGPGEGYVIGRTHLNMVKGRKSAGMGMQYMHTMVRVKDLDASLDFYCNKLGLVEVERMDHEKGRFTLVFLAAPDDVDVAKSERTAMVELTYNWDPEDYDGGRNFGHLAYRVDDIYATCKHLMDKGVTINRPPRDGRMAFVRSPDGISVELLQRGNALEAAEPWASMENTGTW